MKPIKATLEQDTLRGPGYGVLQLEAMNTQEALNYRIESNQKSAEHLQADGKWSSSPVMQTVAMPQANDNGITLFLEPVVINALIKNSRAAYRIVLQDASRQEYVGNIRIKGMLLGSGAQGEGALPPSPIDLPPQNSSPMQKINVETYENKLESEYKETPRKRGLWIGFVAMPVLVVVGAWGACLPIPMLPVAGWCAAEAPQTTPSQEPQAGVVENDAYGQCLALKEGGKLEEARIACLKASQDGNIEAMKEMARMVDPATWSEKISPEPKPNWETAAYWWQQAAREGDIESMRHAGYNMAKYGEYEIDKEKGIALLKQAQSAGDSESTTLLEELQK